jgi:hypothetical protein
VEIIEMRNILFRILAALIGLGMLVAGIDMMFFLGDGIKLSKISMVFMGFLFLFFAATGIGFTGESSCIKKEEVRQIAGIVLAPAMSFCISIAVIMNPVENIAGLIIGIYFLLVGYEEFCKRGCYITFSVFFVIPYAVAVIRAVDKYFL